MDKFQFWLYLIIGVIYVLSRLRKKPEQQPGDTPKYNPSKPVRQFDEPSVKPSGTSAAPSRTLTFEELLQEITEGKAQRQQPQPEYVDYDDNLEEEEKDLEEVEYDYWKQDKVYEMYEDAKQQAFNRPSLEETMKVGDTVMRFEKFKGFEEQEERNLLKEYLSDLNDPEGFKKAVVMSEILQRKF